MKSRGVQGSIVKDLAERARQLPVTDASLEAQRRSFAYGNAVIENPRVTRAIIDEQASRIAPPSRTKAT